MLSIYKASAGSGKTFTLAYRYIKQLLAFKDEKGVYRLRNKAGYAHRSILAITFTNKATDEMKRRIIHELAVLGNMEPQWPTQSDYAPMLINELKCTPQELTDAARTALVNLLFDFNMFQVSTIDSFFQIVLRTFAREAELTGNYEVDLENDRAMETGVRNLFESLRSETGKTENVRMVEWLTQFLLNELREGRGVAIFNRRSGAFGELMQFVKQTDSESFKRHRETMMDYLAQPQLMDAFRLQLTSASSRHKELTMKACRAALDLISARGYDAGKLKIDSKVMDRLSDGALNGFDTAKKEGTTISKVLDDPLRIATANLKKKLETQPDPELTQTIVAAFETLKHGRSYRRLWSELTKQLYTLGLLEGVFKYIEAYRSENNTFLLSDTNAILKDIIGEGDTPFVFERLGVWLDHFLIDEFQDTSLMQWEILKPLVEQGQDTDSDSLIIGDEKQCIYRFRSSDPTLLQNTVKQQFGSRAVIEGDTPEGNTNWRSSAHMVKFNSELFTNLANTLRLKDVYANVVQQVSKKHLQHNGYIAANSISAANLEEFTETSLRLLTEDIRRQLRAGYKGKDICVLVRKRKHGTLIIDHLMHLTAKDSDFSGLRVISDDAMMLNSSPAVRLIVSVLRHINTLSDSDSNQAAEPDSPIEGKTSPAPKPDINRMLNRCEYLRSRGFSAQEALVEAVTHPEGDFNISRETGQMTCFNLPSLVERIIGRMLTDECESQNMFISAFQDVVNEYCSSGNTDLQSFLDWWDAKGCNSTVSAPDDENAIRVMTIHKSKGLEFRCVHVPMLSYSMVDFKGAEWFAKADIPMVETSVVPPLLSLKPSRALEATAFAPQYAQRCREQLLDELNILYVALTRAIDELTFTYLCPAKLSDSMPIGAVLDQCVPTLPLLTLTEPRCEDDADGKISTYTYGSPTHAIPEKEKPPTALDPSETFFMPPYKTADRDDLWANTRIDDVPEIDSPRHRGIMLHDVLSRVNHVSDLHKAVVASVHARVIPAEEADEIETELRAQLSTKQAAQWFSNYTRVATERPIILPDNSNRRPDRVVWTADGYVDVIDYKFGERNKSHFAQVKHYMHLLKQMECENIRGFLWYVDNNKIIPVTQ
ncbi:MAG: UvrD-helicase domain-containing protein [Firmicutes bacterium]|nr:UvrD-helicase domain-containing protein [Bacillota bacterium]MCM1400952.1 UvrD-helicase domain-containing protein [Bacteroides sp.]MCM1476303.1 UvrD-helicase domain-containing protein [Bacteroides sp.]